MIALYVIGALAALFFLLFISCLFTRLRLYIIYYGKNLIIKPGLLFFNFEIPILGTEDFDIPIKERVAEKTETAKKQKKTKKLKLKRKFQRKDLGAVLEFLRNLVTKCLTRFKSYLKLEKYLLKINLATDDPAKTAILYGGLSGVVSGLHGLAEGAKKRSRKETTVYTEYKPDFYSTKTDIEVEIGFSIRGFELIHCVILALPHALKALWYFLSNFVIGEKHAKNKTKGDTEDERILS